MEGEKREKIHRRIFSDHYPWAVVAICFLVLAVSYGIRGAFSVFFVAFLEEFDKSRGSTAGIITLCYLIWAVVSPAVGTVVDRFGVRLTFFMGGLFLLLGLGLTSLSTQFWHLYLFFGIFLSLGLALLDVIPITSFIDQWHVRSKGKAFGVAFSGRGIGHLILLPFSQYLISQIGWRHSFQALGTLCFALVFSLCFLVRSSGPSPGGRLTPEKSPGPSPAEPKTGMGPGEALRTLLFWRLFTLRFFTSYGIYAVSVHLVAYLAGLGFSKIYGATVTGLIGILGFGGAIALGSISDHLGRGKSMIIGFIFSGLGVFFLLLAGSFAWQWIIVLFLVFFGLGYGARGPVFAALASDFFSGQSLGRIYGLITLGVGLGQATGPCMAGLLFDLTGSYAIPFVSVLLSFVFSVILTAGIEKMRLRPNAIGAEVNILGGDRRDRGKL